MAPEQGQINKLLSLFDNYFKIGRLNERILKKMVPKQVLTQYINYSTIRMEV